MRRVGLVAAAGAWLSALLWVAALGDPLGQSPDLDQGWSSLDRTNWYEATQGSRLIPLSWLLALEQPNGTGMFLDDTFIRSFRYIPYTTSGGLRLPIGFAIDDSDDTDLPTTHLRWKLGQTSREPWVGMTCSACHTNEMAFRDKVLRVDGGPTLADFQGFMEAFNDAIATTSTDDAKFGRFAHQVLGADYNPENNAQLRQALRDLVDKEHGIAAMNHTALRYGFGRLDAFGHIFNRVALADGAAPPTSNESDAPVSYPFLWNVPQEQAVQWNGIAPNTRFKPPIGGSFAVGALGRNVAEAIGVFADLKTEKGAPLGGYHSSVNIGNLVALEDLLSRLRPPKWPDAVFGAPDQNLVAKGRVLFAAHCASCHQPLDRTDLRTPIPLKMGLFDRSNGLPAPGTDPWMACNAYLRTAASGNLTGTKVNYFSGSRLPAETALTDLLEAEVTGSLVGEKGDVLKAAATSFFGIPHTPHIAAAALVAPTPGVPPPDPRARQLAICNTDHSPVLGYKARALTGIWATAPYLHNGSVPTLYDLLLPPAQRPTSFYLGTREFDPATVGYLTVKSPSNPFEFRTVDDAGKPIPGNENSGHDYGNANFSEVDRRALVEYLKTL